MATRTKPVGRNTSAVVDTTGVAFALPTLATCLQFKIYVSAAAYVGMGTTASPIPAASTSNSVYQESGTEVVYSLDGATTDGTHIYIYSVAAGPMTARLSYYG